MTDVDKVKAIAEGAIIFYKDRDVKGVENGVIPPCARSVAYEVYIQKLSALAGKRDMSSKKLVAPRDRGVFDSATRTTVNRDGETHGYSLKLIDTKLFEGTIL